MLSSFNFRSFEDSMNMIVVNSALHLILHQPLQLIKPTTIWDALVARAAAGMDLGVTWCREFSW